MPSRRKAGGSSPSQPPINDPDCSSFVDKVQESTKRSYEMFAGNWGIPGEVNMAALEAKIRIKLRDEYPSAGNPVDVCAALKAVATGGATVSGAQTRSANTSSANIQVINQAPATSLDLARIERMNQPRNDTSLATTNMSGIGGTLSIRAAPKIPKPTWHAPWKLMRVISGHQGWVRCVTVDPKNEWFITGANDRLIKIWDLATGTLKLTLTGHINSIRDVKLSSRHPYLFSCAEDNRVKCWDLEQNKVVRDYHGHLSGVYCLAVHPTLDIIVSGGRDAVVRVWDMRTKKAIHVLGGHTATVTSLFAQNSEPQIVSGSGDHHVRLWDLAAGKTHSVLTHHKKSVRALATHPTEYTFASGGADNIKVWSCPDGRFERNIQGHNSIINCCAIRGDESNESSIIVAGTDNGTLHFWDWASGHMFQSLESQVQPGTMESEGAIFACTFDQSASRLITGEGDKTIKIWKEDDTATPDSHPIHWVPPKAF